MKKISFNFIVVLALGLVSYQSNADTNQTQEQKIPDGYYLSSDGSLKSDYVVEPSSKNNTKSKTSDEYFEKRMNRLDRATRKAQLLTNN